MAEKDLDKTPAEAAAFLPHAEDWFASMREAYKEHLAREFEKPEPQQAEVEKTGAKLAVMADMLQVVRGLANSDLVEEFEGENIC